jgi:hypothetical protein
MATIIQGPWKPFSEKSVSQIRTGIWECTIVKLRPRKPAPTEASLKRLKQARKDETARPARTSTVLPAS